MGTIKWSGREWLDQIGYGITHPDLPHFWFDPLQINQKAGILKLGANLTKCPEDNKIRVGVGCISSKDKFSYGRFEILAKLPKGNYLWPAFWLIHSEVYPPEIDIFEAYSNGKASYCNKWYNWLRLNPWKIESNAHIRTFGEKKELGAKRHRTSLKRPENGFIKYELCWYEDVISIRYNDREVRRITDKEVLSRIFPKMRVIINNGARPEALNNFSEETRDFEIQYFKYSPY